VEIEPERPCQLVAEVAAERAAVDPPQHLADQEAEADRVVAVRGAGLPEGLLRRERRGDALPVVERGHVDRLAHRGHARLVAQEPAHRDALLPGLRELGPVLGDRRVEVELARVDQAVGADRGHALRGRVDVGDRVALPGPGARAVAPATPQVDEQLAAQRHRDRRADFAGLEAPLERLAHAREPLRALAADLRHRSPPPRCSGPGHSTWAPQGLSDTAAGGRRTGPAGAPEPLPERAPRLL